MFLLSPEVSGMSGTMSIYICIYVYIYVGVHTKKGIRVVAQIFQETEIMCLHE